VASGSGDCGLVSGKQETNAVVGAKSPSQRLRTELCDWRTGPSSNRSCLRDGRRKCQGDIDLQADLTRPTEAIDN